MIGYRLSGRRAAAKELLRMTGLRAATSRPAKLEPDVLVPGVLEPGVDDAGFRPLFDELDAWAAVGKTATLWWRDDDCIEPTSALDRMIGLSAEYGVPLGLAVIPAGVTSELAQRLDTAQTVHVLQHGFAHTNHARNGERAAEFGPQRTVTTRLTEMADGWQRLAHLPRRVPVFVPPWNRYDADIAAGAAAIGFKVISAFGVRRPLGAGIAEANCHCDIINWKTTRGFTGVTKCVGMLVEHLAARRLGLVAWDDATGVLSHHLVHDAGCWAFLEALFRLTRHHPGGVWISPAALADRLPT